MLYLVTGLPGASKTLNTIKMLSEEGGFKNRPISYFNIKDLALPWSELTRDEAIKWYELPENSVVVLDECQDLFPPRKVGAEVPESVEKLSVHRHRGFDIILITQHPMLLDNAVRRLVGTHYHFVRQYGMKRVKRYLWQKCENDPEDYHAKKDAEKNTVKLDKKYFDVYKSAEVHTHKPKISKKLVYTLTALFFVVSGILWFVSGFSDRKKSDIEETPGVFDKAGILVENSSGIQKQSLPIDPVQYANLYEPRIEGLEYTAPIYDPLTKPKSFPKPSCVLNVKRDICSCYSQQATKLDVPKNMCKNIVENGWFDFTKEDSEPSRSREPFSNRVASLEFKEQNFQRIPNINERREK
ncbi:MAG: hypothetical protein KDC83_14740 [Flavobacteriales bacterium]|nr:hypothetical protein [Flavobacteriales bacterium]